MLPGSGQHTPTQSLARAHRRQLRLIAHKFGSGRACRAATTVTLKASSRCRSRRFGQRQHAADGSGRRRRATRGTGAVAAAAAAAGALAWPVRRRAHQRGALHARTAPAFKRRWASSAVELQQRMRRASHAHACGTRTPARAQQRSRSRVRERGAFERSSHIWVPELLVQLLVCNPVFRIW